MYNIIFYDKIKEIEHEVIADVQEVEDEETGEKKDVIVYETITKKYRVPTKLVFNTATNCDEFFKDNIFIDDFVMDMPSLDSAKSMFENSTITKISGEGEEEILIIDDNTLTVSTSARFPSLTSGDNMFKDCDNLTSISIDLDSLKKVEGLFENCSSLTSFTGSLGSLENGQSLFIGSPNLNTFYANIDSLTNGTAMFKNTKISTFYNELPSLEKGDEMFNSTPLIKFEINMPSLESANSMFQNCVVLETFNSVLGSLKSGNSMFYNCDKLESLILDMPSLESGENMFYSCSKLKSFTGSLSSLKRGNCMFEQTVIATFVTDNLDSLESGNKMFWANKFLNWSIDLPKLKDGFQMFYGSIRPGGNNGLQTFTADLSSLENGTQMFAECSSLQNFNCVLPKLDSAVEMFKSCKLSPQSVMNIVESLPTKNSSRSITIGINSANDTDSLNQFAINTGLYKDWAELNSTAISKNWNITWEYNANTN